MVADFQTSMKEIREANLAFVSLLKQLKSLVSKKGTITIEIGGTPYTFPTIPSVIEQYRDGNFDEVILRSGGTEIHIKNVDGTLQLSDSEGNLVPLSVSELRYASISHCDIESVTVQECSIDSLDARGSVSIDKINCQSLEVDTLGGNTPGYGSFTSLSATNLAAETASLRKVFIRSMVYNPASRIDIFSEGGVPYNYSETDALFVQKAGDFSAYVCREFTPAEQALKPKSPTTMGFSEFRSTNGIPQLLRAPDMVTFCGENPFDAYAAERCNMIVNCYTVGTGSFGTQSVVSDVTIRTGWGSEASGIAFATILGWPLRSFAKDPASDPTIPVRVRQPEGAIFVHEFSSLDTGRIIYIRTLEHAWRIPRRLSVQYENGKPQRGVFDLEYSVPPYTCLRLRAARYAETVDGVTIYRNVLELT